MRKITRREEIMLMIIRIILKEKSKVPILLVDLRNRLPKISKFDFDHAVKSLYKSGKYFPTRHSNPGSLTDAEINALIPDNEGNYYVAINSRENSIQMTQSDNGDYRYLDSIGYQPPPERKRGRGRPPIPEHMKRVRVSGMFRLPTWVIEWLSDQEGSVGDLIEAAVIAHYNLTPPD